MESKSNIIGVNESFGNGMTTAKGKLSLHDGYIMQGNLLMPAQSQHKNNLLNSQMMAAKEDISKSS